MFPWKYDFHTYIYITYRVDFTFFYVNHFVIQNVKRDNSRFSVNHSITFLAVDEEECHLREQVFEFVRNVIQLKLTESQLALFSAVVLIRAGQC